MSTDTRERADKHGEDRARTAVLEVTKTMLNEVGYQHLRVEAVAARAGVPRGWLRRWWTTRPLLVAEALQRMGGPPDVVPTGDVRADVRAIALRTATFLANPVVGDALAGLAADATGDPVAAERLAALLHARRAGDVSVLLSAVARGDLRPDTDVVLVLDVVYGTLLFRLAGGAPPTPVLVDGLVDLVLAGQAAPALRTGDAPVSGTGLDAPLLDGAALVEATLDPPSLDGAALVEATLDPPGLDGATLDGTAPAPAAAAPPALDGAAPDKAALDNADVDDVDVDNAALRTAVIDAAALRDAARRSAPQHGPPQHAAESGAPQHAAERSAPQQGTPQHAAEQVAPQHSADPEAAGPDGVPPAGAAHDAGLRPGVG